MKISQEKNMDVTFKGGVNIYVLTVDSSTINIEPDSDYYDTIKRLYNRTKPLNGLGREECVSELLASDGEDGQKLREVLMKIGATDIVEETKLSKEEKLVLVLEKLMNFFREFEFVPSYRFVNTLAQILLKEEKEAVDYIKSYFNLIDNMYKSEIADKCESLEFKSILNGLKKDAVPTNQINTRLVIYYGSAGTGKTTQAMKESDGRCIVCNSSMLPSDLMEDFVFEEGKPTFQKSSLWNCMEQGMPIVLDEINLLPFDSLRFLQGILDGKKELDYKGNKILIKDGFEVIGTMNLSIGGIVYGLPEPLVDRCAKIKEFPLTAKQLLSAVL